MSWHRLCTHTGNDTRRSAWAWTPRNGKGESADPYPVVSRCVVLYSEELLQWGTRTACHRRQNCVESTQSRERSVLWVRACGSVCCSSLCNTGDPPVPVHTLICCLMCVVLGMHKRVRVAGDWASFFLMGLVCFGTHHRPPTPSQCAAVRPSWASLSTSPSASPSQGSNSASHSPTVAGRAVSRAVRHFNGPTEHHLNAHTHNMHTHTQRW